MAIEIVAYGDCIISLTQNRKMLSIKSIENTTDADTNGKNSSKSTISRSSTLKISHKGGSASQSAKMAPLADATEVMAPIPIISIQSVAASFEDATVVDIQLRDR